MVKSLAVSNTTKPVTHTALVEVKSESIKEIDCIVVDLGNNNNDVPNNIMAAKLKEKIAPGGNFNFKII